MPTPTGVLAVADEVTGPSLAQAAASAKGLIGEEGGDASHIALSPSTIAAEESREGSDGHPVYPNGLTNLSGLQVVSSVSATQPIVYDRTRTYVVEHTAFEITASTDYAPAFETFAVALRIVGRFALSVPLVGPAVRKLTITP